MKKQKALVSTKEERALVAPDYLKGKGRGIQNIDKSDMIIPRIMLIQPLSPAKLDKGIPEGNLMNSLTGKDYGSSIIVIPILHSKGRVCWQDRDLGGGVLCASDDALMPRSISDAHALVKKMSGSRKDPSFTDCANCPLKDWGDTEPPKCSLFNQFAILVEGDTSLAAITMDKTKTKIAKKWLSMMVQSGPNMDIFSRKYKITTRVEKKDKFTYYNLDVEPSGFPTEAEYKVAEGLFESFKNTKITSPEE